MSKKNKKEKKLHKKVKKAFMGDTRLTKSNKHLIDSLAKAVVVNKTMVKRDRKKIENWQNDYYQELFGKFKELVKKHNEIYSFYVDDITKKIETKKRELKSIEEKIASAEKTC